MQAKRVCLSFSVAGMAWHKSQSLRITPVSITPGWNFKALLFIYLSVCLPACLPDCLVWILYSCYCLIQIRFIGLHQESNMKIFTCLHTKHRFIPTVIYIRQVIKCRCDDGCYFGIQTNMQGYFNYPI